MRFTRRGYIECLRDDIFISRHTVAEEAYESAYRHAEENGGGIYTIRYPIRELDLTSLTRTVLSDTIAPSAPTLTATGGSGQVSLSWTASTDNVGVRGYTLQWSTNAVSGYETLQENAYRTYTHLGLNGAAQYFYRVSAYDASGNVSDWAYANATTNPVTELWGTMPNVVFTANSAIEYFSFSSIAPSWATLFYSTGNDLPAGVTIDSANKRLVKAASAVAASQSGIILSTEPLQTAAEEDWAARIATDGVVWHHDFDFEDEVNFFRKDGTTDNPSDVLTPNTVRWRQDDGPRGNCLEIWRAAGDQDPCSWWRPTSPLNAASTGRGAADPGDGITPLQRTAVQGTSNTRYWDYGWYGNPIYWPGENFDGHDWWLQVRVKIDPNRIAGTNRDGGKLFYFTRAERTNTSQEIVTYSAEEQGGLNRFHCYYNSPAGARPIAQASPGVDVHGHHPGSEWGQFDDGLCFFDNRDGKLVNCWYWPLGEWATILYYIRGGTNANGELPSDPTDPTGNPDTLVKVWVAKPGESSYTQIFNVGTLPLAFDIVGGHNSVIASGYMNVAELTIDTAFYHRYAQFIFKRGNGNSANPEIDGIPCPQDPTQLGT